MPEHMTEWVEPTHFLSIHSKWLTRDEWEVSGYPSVSEEEKKNRINRRVSFLVEMHSSIPGGLKGIKREDIPFSAKEAIRTYSEGGEGRILSCFEERVFIQPGYATDDSDGLWIFSEELLQTILEIAERTNLFVIKSEAVVGSNAEPPTPRSTP